jgi:hypothetical protein
MMWPFKSHAKTQDDFDEMVYRLEERSKDESNQRDAENFRSMFPSLEEARETDEPTKVPFQWKGTHLYLVSEKGMFDLRWQQRQLNDRARDDADTI